MTQIALITGASRGLGHALARTLAPQYHIVAVGKTVGSAVGAAVGSTVGSPVGDELG